MKAQNGWSDNRFYKLLSFLGDIFPEDNNIPKSIYRTKKTLLMQVDVRCVKFQNGSKTLRRKMIKEYK